MKKIGICLDSETSDLAVSVVRDASGMIVSGLQLGNTLYQNQYIILKAQKGEIPEVPTLGAAIDDMLGDDDELYWKRTIREQLTSDGMVVDTVSVDFATQKVQTKADYA